MFDCELKKIPINLMHKDCMGLPQLELACCWYDPCQQGCEIGAFFTEIFSFKFFGTVVILNSNLHYQIFKFVIDNSDITSLNCLQHIQKRRNFDAKVTCHQPICLLLHAILLLSGVGVTTHTYTVCGQYSVLTTYGT